MTAKRNRPWPAEQIEQWPHSRLKPSPHNARTHSPAQIEQIAASITQWGWTMPILADEQDGIIAGHARWQAAAQLGIAQVPVMVARGWTKAQVHAYMIADNRLALNADWDEALLVEEIEATAAESFDVSLLGFNEAQIAHLTAGEQEPFDAEAAWRGMPAFHQDDLMPWRTVVLLFRNQADVDAFARAVGQELKARTRFLWHPANERVPQADRRWVSTDATAIPPVHREQGPLAKPPDQPSPGADAGAVSRRGRKPGSRPVPSRDRSRKGAGAGPGIPA